MWTAIAYMRLPQQIRTSSKRATQGLSSLLREKSRDMLAFAFFLIISSGFWLLQKLDDNIETDITVPLELVNVPNGVIITSPLPEQVTVTVRDRGTNLFSYMQSTEGVEPIRLDYAIYDNGAVAGKTSVSATDVQRAFLQQMNSSVEVVRMHPSKFEFHFNRGLSRLMPVKFVGSVATHQQNYLMELTFEPDSVTVYAPSPILDTLKYAYTDRLDIRGLDETTTFDLAFSKTTGMKVVPEQVRMTAHVDYYTERTVEVPVVGLNFPAGITLKTFPAEVTIKYRVGAAVSRNITAENFVLAATYEELLNNNSGKFRLQLKSIPVGVSNVRIYPSEVDYLLEQMDENAGR